MCEGISLNGVPLTEAIKDCHDEDLKDIIQACICLNNIIKRRCPKLKSRAERRGPIKIWTREEIRRIYG